MVEDQQAWSVDARGKWIATRRRPTQGKSHLPNRRFQASVPHHLFHVGQNWLKRKKYVDTDKWLSWLVRGLEGASLENGRQERFWLRDLRD